MYWAAAKHQAEGYNPLCGDKLKLYLRMRTTSSKTQLRRQRLRHFHRVGIVDDRKPEGPQARGSAQAAGAVPRSAHHGFAVTQELGKLVVFCGVRDYPARVKCATLAGTR